MPSGKGYTVTYDGVASTSLDGFMCHEVSRGLLAARRTAFEDVPGREGAFLFPEQPGMRAMSIDCSVLVDSFPVDRREAVRKVASWYNKETMRKLSISDEPGFYEMAIPAAAPDVTEWRQRGAFELPFLCEPYTYETALRNHNQTAGTASVDITINNPGDVWTPLIVQITAAGASATQSITINGRTWARATAMTTGQFVTFNTRAGVITNVANTDTDLQGLFNANQVSMATATGRPPFLAPGNNTLTVAAAHTGYTVNVWWRGRFS